ncbi:MAG: glycosyltransferase [Planctomycetes bacterium]|nr:glycosyltransferase [Planctomycetota bacterium]
MSDSSPPSGIDTSILVTTFRRPRHLALVLESIALQRRVPRDFEVIVADDGSDDTTADVVAAFAATADFPVRFTTEPHDGFRLARTRNHAARLAKGDYLLFLDGDCILPRGHLAAHRDRRRRGLTLLGHCARLGEETSRLLVPENLSITNLAGLVSRQESRALARRHRRARWHAAIRHPSKPRLTGGDFGVWRTDFERVNGFDERFVGWGQEDDDLGLRLRAAGVRLESVLDLTWSLHVWHTTDPTATRRWRDGANVPYFGRRGRLTVCRRGLRRRGRDDLVWGLPADLDATPLGRAVDGLLIDAPRPAAGAGYEIELVVWPARVGFTRASECRLLLVPRGLLPPRRLAARADHVVAVDPDDPQAVAEVLDAVG